MNHRNLISLPNDESAQALSVQSQNLDLVPFTNHIKAPSNGMEIETVYNMMIKQIKDLGTLCGGNWASLAEKISEIQERNTSVEEAVSELIRKDIETTTIVTDQIVIIESTAQALN